MPATKNKLKKGLTLSDFALSQILILLAILCDLASFQFKQRSQIVSCLCLAGILICSHFLLLDQYTAAALMALATFRYFCSIFSTSTYLMQLFLGLSLVIATYTYTGWVNILSLIGSGCQTVAAFTKSDRELRLLMMVGTGFWLVHNSLVQSPLAVIMEAIFITSNMIGYYRFYIAPAKSLEEKG